MIVSEQDQRNVNAAIRAFVRQAFPKTEFPSLWTQDAQGQDVFAMRIGLEGYEQTATWPRCLIYYGEVDTPGIAPQGRKIKRYDPDTGELLGFRNTVERSSTMKVNLKFETESRTARAAAANMLTARVLAGRLLLKSGSSEAVLALNAVGMGLLFTRGPLNADYLFEGSKPVQVADLELNLYRVFSEDTLINDFFNTVTDPETIIES